MKILIAEDNKLNQIVIKNLLTRLGECTIAEDGEQAITQFRSAHEAGAPFDLICLDIMMPGQDGQQVLQCLRELEQQRGIEPFNCVKVIMTTGLSDPGNVLTAFMHGCEAYVTKPIDKQIFFQELEKLGIKVEQK